jgi:hypothetical protein
MSAALKDNISTSTSPNEKGELMKLFQFPDLIYHIYSRAPVFTDSISTVSVIRGLAASVV